jgi:predicted ATP-grasp superfamily ATP-dependent carboligase
MAAQTGCHLRWTPIAKVGEECGFLMPIKTAESRNVTDDADTKLGHYDVLILDASMKQSLASVRSLGKAGLRVAAGESVAQFSPALPLPAFRSRYCLHELVLPSLITDEPAFVAMVIEFVRAHSPRVVLPTSDMTIAVLRPYREQLAEMGCFLALATDAALDIANDKSRTLAVARELGIAQPTSMRIDSLEDLEVAIAKLGFPFVLKPIVSWTGQADERLYPVDVIDSTEAAQFTEKTLAVGSGLLAQQWVPGRREGVTLFIADDEILVGCGHVAHRTTPPLGGASVVRESIEPGGDTMDAAVRLAKAIGLQGVCEVEFRRDAEDRPLLMEINARLAGTIENAVQSGIDFPLMIWRWGTGLDIEPVTTYRSGIRSRWLYGDLLWLLQNWGRAGRPDSVSRFRSVFMIISEFAKTFHYDYFNSRDPGPFFAELRYTARACWKFLR